MEANRITHCLPETEDTQLDLWELLGSTRVVTDALEHRLVPAKASSREEKDRSAAALDGQVAGREVVAGFGKPQGAAKAGFTGPLQAGGGKGRPRAWSRRR